MWSSQKTSTVIKWIYQNTFLILISKNWCNLDVEFLFLFWLITKYWNYSWKLFSFSAKVHLNVDLQAGIFKTGVTKMFSFAKKGKATVIRYLVTVLRDRERRSFFLHLLRSFFLGLLYISSYSIGSGGQENVRQGSLATRYGLRLPPLRFLYLSFFPVYVFIQNIF